MSRVTLARWWPVLTAITLGAPALALGAPVPHDKPLWILSLNYGYGQMKLVGDPLNRENGYGPGYRLDYVTAPGVMMGLDLKNWTASDSGLSRSLRVFTATLTKFPAGRGFFVRGGAGVCTTSQETTVFDASGVSSTVTQEDGGFAVSAATGYELRIRKNFALGLEAEYSHLGMAQQGGYLTTGILHLGWTW
jgi:hypothetical protein